MNKCSRAGCAESATHLISWRNPKIHPESRTKSWGACDEHRSFLVDYLTTRGFFLGVVEIE
nr:acetone carboxylase [Aquiluna borgnonia]